MIVLGHLDEAVHDVCCHCRQPVSFEAGLNLMDGSPQALVCVPCGRRRVPALAALLKMAKVAEEVGRVHYHNRSWPAMDRLLKLASASEEYYQSLARRETAA